MWDEFLVDAWEKNGGMFIATWQFLTPHGISKEMLGVMEPRGFFAKIGVTARAPKVRNHLFFPVKAFFYQFFPAANELLWEGKKLEALQAMRRYHVEEERVRQNREMRNLKKDISRKKIHFGSPILIPGTGAVHIHNARRSISDWKTVKPSRHRQRIKRL